MAQLDRNAVIAHLDTLLSIMASHFTPARSKQSKVIDALEPNDLLRHYLTALRIKLAEEDSAMRVTPLMQRVIDEVKGDVAPD